MDFCLVLMNISLKTNKKLTITVLIYVISIGLNRSKVAGSAMDLRTSQNPIHFTSVTNRTCLVYLLLFSRRYDACATLKGVSFSVTDHQDTDLIFSYILTNFKK